MSVEAFQRRPTKVPPATKAKPKKDKSYEEHSFQPKPSGNVRRESESKGDEQDDFSKMIARAASLRRNKSSLTYPYEWNPEQKESLLQTAKLPETVQHSSSKLTGPNNPAQVPAPVQALSHLPPQIQNPPLSISPRNTSKSATMTHSTSSSMIASSFQTQTSNFSPQTPPPSFLPQTPAQLLRAQSPSAPVLPLTSLPKPQSSPFASQVSQAQFSQPASQSLTQSLREDEDDELYDDVESLMQKFPPPLPSTDVRLSQSFGKSSMTAPTVPSTPRPSFAQRQQSNPQLLRPQIPLSDTGKTQSTIDTRTNMGGYSLSSPMSMSEFFSKYQDELPVKMKVQDVPQGMEGLSQGDILSVHFSKSTKVAVVSDSSKAQHIVPFNSAVKFGILFNPYGNTNAATQGYQFPTIGDITSLGSLPPVICARASYEVSAADSSVQPNDILIVKELKNQWRGRSLVCIDVKSKQKKKLLESCAGNFSTSPLDVSLHLPDIIANIPLPQQCILSYSGPNAPEVTSLLPKGCMILRSTAVNKTVIASKEDSRAPVVDMLKQFSPCLLEIPANLDATVQVISTSDSVAQHLLQESCEVHQKMSTGNFSSVSRYVLPNANRHQLTFLSTICHDKPNVGVTLTRPTRNTSSIPHSASTQDLTEEDDLVDSEYDIPQVAIQSFLEKQQTSTTSHYVAPRPANITSTSGPISDEIYDIPANNAPLFSDEAVPSPPITAPKPPASDKPDLFPEAKDIRMTVEKLEKGFTNLRKDRVSSPPIALKPPASDGPDLSSEMKDIRMTVKSLEKGFTNLKKETDTLRKEVASLKQQLNQQGGRQGFRSAAELETAQQIAIVLSDPQQNKGILATFSCQQVQQLLREMNLEPYIDIFAQEQINGSLLVDCDEKILQDLGISSKLHQLRLMNLISGKVSTKGTSEKDHYVTCYKS